MHLVPRRSLLAALAATLTLTALPTSSLRAQLPDWSDSTKVPRSCLGPDGLPPRAPSLGQLISSDAPQPFARVPKEAYQSIDLTTEIVARYMRNALGAPEGLLPPLDTTRSAGHYHGWVTVVARPDGSL